MQLSNISRFISTNKLVFKAPALATVLLLNLISLGFCQENTEIPATSKQKDLFSDRIKILGGTILLDGAVEATQRLKLDRQATFVGISTPSTPSTNHANLWLNNTTKQLCTNFDDGSAACLATGASTTGYLTESSATLTYLTKSSATVTYGQLAGPNAWTNGNTFSSATFSASPRLATVTNTVLATNEAGVIISTTISSSGLTAGSSPTITGTWLFSGSTTIKGTTTSDNAAPGYIGEYMSSTAGYSDFPASAQFGDLTSFSLTAGDWDVKACLTVSRNGASISVWEVGFSASSGNDSTGLVRSENLIGGPIPTSTPDSGGCIGPFRVSLSGTTTYYLKYTATYTTATPQAKGNISARRMR